MNSRFIGIFEILLTVIAFGLAVCTVTPNESTSISNFFGYKSTCPMAPLSTFICLAVSGVSFYLFKVKRRAYNNYIQKKKNNTS